MLNGCNTPTLLAGAVVCLLIGCRSDGFRNRASVQTQPPRSSRTIEEGKTHTSIDGESAIQLVNGTEESTSASLNPQVAAARLTLRQAIETGLLQNPDLIAQRQMEGVSSAALGVAQTYPFNPYIQVQATPLQSQPNAGPGTTYHYVLLMQQIQLAGQQQFREEIGTASLNSVRWNLLQAELINVTTTQRLYFNAVYQKGLRDLAKLNADNNQEFLHIIEKQLAAGQATAADAAMLRMDARSTRQQYLIAEANYATALLDLRRQLALPHETPIELDTDVITWNWASRDGVQLATQATYRPDVMAARADVDAARSNTCLADASRVPDVQIGPYYQRTQNGGDFLGFRAQMDLPVLNSGMPLVRQREAELQQRVVAWNQLQLRATLEAKAAADRYERARHLVSEFTFTGTGNLPEELQHLEEQYRAGEVDVVRVIQARNSLIQCRRADLDSINELFLAATAVTAAAGVPIESLIVVNANPVEQKIGE